MTGEASRSRNGSDQNQCVSVFNINKSEMESVVERDPDFTCVGCFFNLHKKPFL